MTKVLTDLEGVTVDEKGMTSQNPEKSGTPGKSNSGMDPLGANSEIARKLRQYYEELICDDVPERFSQLLEQLEREEQPQSGSEGD